MKKQIQKLAMKISGLETIEEKSFWIVAPAIAFLGIASLTTSGAYPDPTPSFVAAFFDLFIPVVLMIFVSKRKNYHSAYPLLCISIGAVSIPLTFVFNGGFLSGMPLFCVITTAITVLCYSPKWRIFSLLACLAGNTVAFIYVYEKSALFPLVGTETLYSDIVGAHKVYDDILFSFYFASIAMFVTINFIITDIRKYRLSQEALQKFFDIEKRNEILKKALSNEKTVKSDHKKAVILFADISNFTPISEKMPSDMIAEFLNEFFSTAGKYIHSTGGVIDKYIGDCIMAYWFDQENGNCVLSAVQAMLNLKQEIFQKTEMIYEKYGTELNFSVGLAYGDVIFGDIGSDTMHDYTVIGDAVNTASRIGDYAVSGEMLISDAAAEMVKDSVILENVEFDHFFKGKNKSVDLYRVIQLADEKQNTQMVQKALGGYSLHICGCRGSFPVSGLRFSEYGGETSCYIVQKNDYAVIVDCGTGLKNGLDVLRDCKKIDILLTHVHYDHILGLLMSKFPVNATVRVFGNFGSWSSESNTLEEFMQHPYWPVEIVDTQKISVDVGTELELYEDIRATFYRSDHPDDACVIKLMCGSKKVVVLADCENAASLDSSISQDSDILLFDGMFDDTDKVSHKGWGHGTWQDGIRFMEGKNIKKMVITHHNPEVGDHSLMLKEVEARKLAPNVSFAKSGDIFVL